MDSVVFLTNAGPARNATHSVAGWGAIMPKYIISMVDPLLSLFRLRDRLEGLNKAKKQNISLVLMILMLGIGLFFYFFTEFRAYAKNYDKKDKIASEIIDPLDRAGKGILSGSSQVSLKNCQNTLVAGDTGNSKKSKLRSLVTGYPMEEMAPYIEKRNKEVASYLIAIAKKESDWGKHSPVKNGRTCYNYWGYRGGHNPTESGYSCFDSAEQAIRVVGDRIENLVSKKINTPTKMVVWKCGADCNAAGGQDAANKWIADVSFYYKKLNS